MIPVCPKGKPGFHAEWLRDEPCDATTTCLGKPGVWCQLSPVLWNMRFGGRFRTLSRGVSQGTSSHFTFALFEPVTRSYLCSLSLLARDDDDCIRIALSGMWQILRNSAAFHLWRVFFSARGGF